MSEKTIYLNKLDEACGLSPARCAAFVEAAIVGLEGQSHRSGVMLRVEGQLKSNFTLVWEAAHPAAFESWQDPDDAVENGACAIAIFYIFEFTPLHVVSRSVKGGGYDFLLGNQFDTNKSIRSVCAKLEVSGILKGAMKRVNARLKEKCLQVQKDSSSLPMYVVVTEFSRPLLKNSVYEKQ